MKNKMEDLRNHLFAVIEGLLDEDKPMDTDRARAVADVAGKLIDSAKVEVQYMKVLSESPDLRKNPSALMTLSDQKKLTTSK